LPETLADLKALVLPLGRTPGLNTIVFNDAAAPGYEWQSRTDSGNAGLDFGYTLQNRLAFLRRGGSDPIDLDGGIERTSLSEIARLPFFDWRPGMVSEDSSSNHSDPAGSWDDLRTRQQIHVLEALRDDLDKANHGLSFYLSASSNEDYHLWTKSEKLASDSPNDSDSQKPTIPRYHHRHDEYIKALAAHEYPDHTSEAGAIATQLHSQLGLAPYDKGQSSEYAVLDLTSMPVRDAIPLIEGALLPAK
jgi:hypothetical protein